ncbi:MAG TPA: hypothetical protein PLR99_12280, partial [Polyangiaceae bacterium]|nr:hypothetical protein [Polyangiaceae bacterium]
LEHAEPVRVTVTTEGSATVDAADARATLGHLDGWGRGLYDGSGALYFQRSRGNTGEARVRLLVRGEGALTLRVGSCRVGHREVRLTT